VRTKLDIYLAPEVIELTNICGDITRYLRYYYMGEYDVSKISVRPVRIERNVNWNPFS